jgi:hypothetical protein
MFSGPWKEEDMPEETDDDDGEKPVVKKTKG